MGPHQKRIIMRASLDTLPHLLPIPLLTPTQDDVPRLAVLMHRAYVGTVDYEGEDELGFREEIHRTFNGAYGPFDHMGSRMVAEDRDAVSCALLTRWQDRPFVAYSVTTPSHQRRGLARACLVSAMHVLRARGETELRLVVTPANTRAVNLYSGIGFQQEAET
jgi:ribosomal protein S18 acetylase RimI-like enzyme